jgi:hypothetical protein
MNADPNPAAADATTTPNQVHAAAIKDHTEALARQQSADAELAAATLEKQNLLRQAADGGDVGTADIRAAEEAIREAEASAVLARAVTEGQRRRMDRAEIAVLTARAAELTESWRKAVQRRIAAAQAVDDALEAARAKMAEFDDAHLDQSVVFAEANHHDQHVAQRAGENAELAAIQTPYRPRCANRMALHEHTSLEISYVARSWGGRVPRETRMGPLAQTQYASQLPLTAPTKAA